MSKSKKIVLVCLILIGFCIKLYGQTGQETKVSVNYQQKSLSEILKDLERLSGLKFSFDSRIIPLEKKVTFKRTSMPIIKVCQELFASTGLEISVNGDHIILKGKGDHRVSVPPVREILYQTVRGTVTDRENRIPLPGVTVAIISVDPVVYASTNLNGEFRFQKVPLGRHTFLFTYMGYKKHQISDMLVNSGKELVLPVSMEDGATMLNDVVITDKTSGPLNDMATVSTRTISVQEASRYAASVFDPARMVMNFAGLTFDSDSNNEIIVRGNSPKGVLWRLEGAEMMQPNHFGDEGGSGGGISMISSNMLATSDFLTGAFPAEYGNALSGVFDLQFRKGNTEKRESAVSIGVLGTEVSAEGPFRRDGKSSYLVNYRYSTLSLLDKVGFQVVRDGGVLKYQDLAFNLNFPSKSGSISWYGITGISKQDDHADTDFSKWQVLDDKMNSRYKFTSGTTGIKHLKIFNNKLYLKNNLSATYRDVVDNMDSLDLSYQASPFSRGSYKHLSLNYTGMLNYKVDSRNSLRAGVIASNLAYDVHSDFYKHSIGRMSTYLDANGSTQNYETYVQWKSQLTRKMEMTSGVHTNYFALSKKWNIEPRLGIRYSPTEKAAWSFGTGLHSKIEPLALYFAADEKPDGSVVRAGHPLDMTRAFHVVLGYENHLTEKTRVKFETYYQYLYDVPVSSDEGQNFSAINFTDIYSLYDQDFGDLNNEGSGTNYGIEATLERSLNGGFYYLATASLYDSKFKGASGLDYNTIFNGKFVTNFVAGKEYRVGVGKRNLLGFNVKLVWNGGRKYSPIDLASSIGSGEQVTYEGLVNTSSTPQYFRVDVSSSFKYNRPKVTHSINLDIQNLTDRANLYHVYYDDYKKGISRQYHTGLVPVLNYKLEF